MWPDDEAKQGVSVSLLLWKEEGHILNCPDEEYCDTCGEACVLNKGLKACVLKKDLKACVLINHLKVEHE